MLKILLIIKFICVLIIVPPCCSARDFDELTPKEKIFFGGDFSLNFGRYTYIHVSPVVGYRLTQRLSAGTGPMVIYENISNYNYESLIYGGKVFTSYNVFNNLYEHFRVNIGSIMLHAENEVINVEAYTLNSSGYYQKTGNRVWVDNLLAGAGLRQPIGRRAAVNILLLWDITQNKYSPYSNPIFKIGFQF